jgi:hypothetical protein
VKFCPFFLVRRKLPFFGQNCKLLPALEKMDEGHNFIPHKSHLFGQIPNTMGDFKVGFSIGVYCTKCTLNTGVNTNFEIAHCIYDRKIFCFFGHILTWKYLKAFYFIKK